jgi:hypothetical protein
MPGKVLQLQNERIRIAAELDEQANGVHEMTLPLTSLSVLWLTDESAEAVDALRRVQSQRLREDTVILRNGDTSVGMLTALDDKAVQLPSATNKEIRLDRPQVAVVALSSDLARTARLKGIYGRLVLANGCRLTVASARSDGQVLNARLASGPTIQVPVHQIAALDLFQGRAVYLSDVKPSRYEHVPYLDVSWPYRADTSVAGNAIRLGGSTYDKGIGMHSESRLTYDLDGRYQWFEALVGLDDETGQEGSVSIQVLVDDKPQDVGGELELDARNSPRSIRAKLTGAKKLTLVVKFGRHGDVQDHIDWADARLIK